MHCPRCGQEQQSEETRFCAKCGLEISDVKQFLSPEKHKTKANRKRKINKAQRQGVSMIFFGLVLILILTILRDFFPIPKALITGSLLVFMVGGMIRMISPYIFGGSNLPEKKADLLEEDSEKDELPGNQFSGKTLPEAEYRPPLDFGAKNYDTNELIAPSSVTEDTTKNLAKKFQTEL